jgi:hypothetical protein
MDRCNRCKSPNVIITYLGEDLCEKCYPKAMEEHQKK